MTSVGRLQLMLVAAILAVAVLPASQAAAYVYWAQPNSDGSAREIARANLDGSGAGQTLVAIPSLVHGIAVDSSHVYWASGSAIGRVDLDGTE